MSANSSFFVFNALVISLLLGVVAPSLAQHNDPTHLKEASKDAKATVIMEQMVNALGGRSARNMLKDSTCHGYLQRYGFAEVSTIVIRTKGLTKLRIDITTDAKTFTYVKNDDQGWWARGDSHKRLPYEQSYSQDIFHFPLLSRTARVPETSMRFEYRGLISNGQVDVYQIALIDETTATAHSVTLSNETILLSVDANTYLPLSIIYNRSDGVMDRTSDSEQFNFSDFRAVEGVITPFRIARIIGGKEQVVITCSDIQINSDISDTEFETKLDN